MEIAAYLKKQSQQVDQALDHYTTAVGQGDMLHLDTAPSQLLEAMRYSLLAGGKRLRPALVIAAAGLFGRGPLDVMPAACALEMIHTYSLIHDDLPAMDDDDLRRGRPTNHKVYGEALAILAGDALLTMAFELAGQQIQLPGSNPTTVLQVVRELAVAAGAAGMVGGQVEDLKWEGKHASADQLQQIHRLKTGALFNAALRIGGLLGGATTAELEALSAYAAHFGLAFQIQDDVLDVIGDAAKTGKGVGRDAKLDKSTYVSHFGLDGAIARARAEVDAAKAALHIFGERAAVLTALAQFVVDREG
ncbi:MAG: polyprenyl synthetase family protein [Mycobacterium leprae]